MVELCACNAAPLPTQKENCASCCALCSLTAGNVWYLQMTQGICSAEPPLKNVEDRSSLQLHAAALVPHGPPGCCTTSSWNERLLVIQLECAAPHGGICRPEGLPMSRGKKGHAYTGASGGIARAPNQNDMQHCFIHWPLGTS